MVKLGPSLKLSNRGKLIQQKIRSVAPPTEVEMGMTDRIDRTGDRQEGWLGRQEWEDKGIHTTAKVCLVVKVVVVVLVVAGVYKSGFRSTQGGCHGGRF